MKILIADDEHELSSLIADWLRRNGHEVDIARDGNGALEQILKNSYDLAFLDFSMPDMTGLELCEHLKRKMPKATAVMMTGYALVEDSLLKAAGIDEVLSKPFKFEEIESIVKRKAAGKS